MDLRLKFGNRRARVTIQPEPAAEISVADVLSAAASVFEMDRDVLQVSLNGRDLYGIENGNLTVSEWGIVSGDLIFVSSTASASPPATSSNDRAEGADVTDRSTGSTTATRPPPLQTKLPPQFHALMDRLSPKIPLHYLSLALHTLLMDSSFRLRTDAAEPEAQAVVEDGLPNGWDENASVVRFSYFYCEPGFASEEAIISVTLVDAGGFLSVTAQVIYTEENMRVCAINLVIPTSEHILQDASSQELSIVDETNLAIRLLDGIVGKVQQEIHSHFELRSLGIHKLPTELLMRILGLLDPRSICRMEKTCRMYWNFCRYGGIWKMLFRRDFRKEYDRLGEAIKTNQEHDWKMSYCQTFQARRSTAVRFAAFSPFPAVFPPPSFSDFANSPLNLREPPGMIGGRADLFPRFPTFPF